MENTDKRSFNCRIYRVFHSDTLNKTLIKVKPSFQMSVDNTLPNILFLILVSD